LIIWYWFFVEEFGGKGSLVWGRATVVFVVMGLVYY